MKATIATNEQAHRYVGTRFPPKVRSNQLFLSLCNFDFDLKSFIFVHVHPFFLMLQLIQHFVVVMYTHHCNIVYIILLFLSYVSQLISFLSYLNGLSHQLTNQQRHHQLLYPNQMHWNVSIYKQGMQKGGVIMDQDKELIVSEIVA